LAYAAWAALVTLMVNAVGWWVAVDCETTVLVVGLKQTLLQLWGHLWYDSYLAISYILFLFFALKFIPAVPPPQEMNWGQRLRFLGEVTEKSRIIKKTAMECARD
jgi:hypothetical protein